MDWKEISALFSDSRPKSSFGRKRKRTVGKQTHKQCMICDKFINVTNGSAGLRKHIKTHECEMMTSASTTGASTDGANVIPYAERPLPDKHHRSALLTWIILSNQPFQEVESASFRDMMSIWNSAMRIPSRRTLKRDLDVLYEQALPRVVGRIRRKGGRIALQHDGWTSTNQTLSYYALLCSYIESSAGSFTVASKWSLKQVLLSMDELSSGTSHSGDAIATDIFAKINQLGLEDRVQALVTDSGGANPQAFSKLQAMLKEEGRILEDGAHLRCAAHVMNLVAKEFLVSLGATGGSLRQRQVERDASSIRSSTRSRPSSSFSPTRPSTQRVTRSLFSDTQSRIETIRLTPAETDEPEGEAMLDTLMQLTEENDEMGTIGSAVRAIRFACTYIHSTAERLKTFDRIDTKPKRPVNEVVTRWTSTRDMLQRASEIKTELIHFPVDDKWKHRWPTYEDFYKARYVKEALQVCADAINGFQQSGMNGAAGSTVVRMNKVFDAFNELQKNLHPRPGALTHDQVEDLRNAYILAENKLSKYYSKTGTATLCACTFVDPRIRGAFWETYDMDDDDNQYRQSAEDKVKRLLDRNYPEESTTNREQYRDDGNPLLWGSRRKDDLFQSELVRIATRATRPSEISAYGMTSIAEPRANANLDPLDWWGDHCMSFPRIARMASDHLGIPSSSADAERVFSDARRIITFDRNAIHPRTVSKILCLKSWIKAFGSDWIFNDFKFNDEAMDTSDEEDEG